MNVLTGNPFVTISDGTEKTSVPSTFLPEVGEQFDIVQNAAQMFPSLFPEFASSQPSTMSQVASAAQTAASVASLGGIPGPGSLEEAITGKGGFSISSIVTILVGILFLAAGIFSFKGARDTIITTAKTAAVAA